MEVLVRYGTPEQRQRWLDPLLAGEIRSAFAMTEPDVASSDATNIDTRIRRDANDYLINGRKWWTSGALDPRCKIMIVMGQSDPEHSDHSRLGLMEDEIVHAIVTMTMRGASSGGRRRGNHCCHVFERPRGTTLRGGYRLRFAFPRVRRFGAVRRGPQRYAARRLHRRSWRVGLISRTPKLDGYCFWR
jgi:hypothetical protein